MNVQSILSDAGVSFGALTLSVLLRGLAALLLGLLLVKLLLKLGNHCIKSLFRYSPTASWRRINNTS